MLFLDDVMSEATAEMRRPTMGLKTAAVLLVCLSVFHHTRSAVSCPQSEQRDPRLQVHVSRRSSASFWTTLECRSSCPLPDRPTFTWYKNGQLIKEGPPSHSDYFYGPDSVSCALKGYEDFPSPSVYPSKRPSVSVSPSAEIVEGSSVTLSCSTDANPAANYTWYKEDEDSPKASGQNFTITDVRAEHSGNYYCEAQNSRGRCYSASVCIVVSGKYTVTVDVVRMTLVVLLLVPLLVLCLWTRRKTPSFTSKPNEPIEMMELQSARNYSDPPALKRVRAARTEDSEEEGHLV